jgi:hypothetical protein
VTDNNQNLEGKLVQSIEAKEIGELIVDYAEIGLDKLLEEEIVKDIPILRTAYSLVKVGLNIRDRLYIKKVYGFLVQVGQTDQKEREKFIRDNCQNVRQFEEAVLLILEQADNMNKSTLIGKIFKNCILGKISYQDSLALSSIVNKMLWQDLENIFRGNFNNEVKMRLCNCGLLNLSLMKLTHIDKTKKLFNNGKTLMVLVILKPVITKCLWK